MRGRSSPTWKLCLSKTMTTPDSTEHTPDAPDEDTLRPHSYDGIQEYDKRLPRWWLLTLYGAMVFAVCYWGILPRLPSPAPRRRGSWKSRWRRTPHGPRGQSGVLSDAVLWKMRPRSSSRGRGARPPSRRLAPPAHKPDLTGLIGPNLLDHEWIHGGKPMEVITTITGGVLAKGMPAWGAIAWPAEDRRSRRFHLFPSRTRRRNRCGSGLDTSRRRRARPGIRPRAMTESPSRPSLDSVSTDQ